jgi:hypothetical protein
MSKILTGKSINISNSNIITGTTTGTFNTLNPVRLRIFKEAYEVGETIEMIYIEKTSVYRTTHGELYNDEIPVKFIFSCIDGKWNKSEPIYGKIIPAQEERFEFE